MLNAFVKEHSIHNVLEWGCGDGNQCALFAFPSYIGLDVSPTAIKNNRQKFSNDKTKTFFEVKEYLQQNPPQSPLSISLDVIYHLVDDSVFDTYMRHLFASSYAFVIIYSSNKTELHWEHVKHRKFTDWVKENAPSWNLSQVIPNKYPFDEKNPNHTSFADFYIFALTQNLTH
ncbi:class I SAM-dependent methyltransferase [Helicobacter sp. MIT 05-5293]|uniref:class I SAM-dependent methyltransferase n=1 Tax=Helicobacter sp. MIT 05-5293 TaxID=1548149 RepID=UPI000A7EF1A9|nr:class I SAM-dependent methyltransferase [Helicobacter sp. MIT 05-5293]